MTEPREIGDKIARLTEILGDAKDKLARVVSGIRYSDSDHLGFMALCFLTRQFCHAESMLCLAGSRDVLLVARSMTEGMCLLLWAAEDDTRALKWRTFAIVSDWRLMRSKNEAGAVVPEERRHAIEEGLARYGDAFLTKTARQAKAAGWSLPDDPYVKDWKVGYDMRGFCERVDVPGIYTSVYGPLSDWVHWGTASVARGLAREEGAVSYRSEVAEDAGFALGSGLAALLQTAAIASEHLKLGAEATIEGLRARYFLVYREGRTVSDP